MLRNTEGSIWPASRTPSSTGVSKARCSGVKLYAPCSSATPVRSRRSWAAARDADGAAGDAGGAAVDAAAGQGGLGLGTGETGTRPTYFRLCRADRAPGAAVGGGGAAAPLPRDAADEPSGGMVKPAMLMPRKDPFFTE